MADLDGSHDPGWVKVKNPWGQAYFVSNPFVILAFIVAVTFFVAIVRRRKKFISSRKSVTWSVVPYASLLVPLLLAF